MFLVTSDPDHTRNESMFVLLFMWRGLEQCFSVRSHIDWRGEQNIAYKGVETSSYQTPLKTLRGSPKRIIFASGGFRLLQMVS